MFPVVVSADHPTTGDIDYQPAAGLGCAEGTNHASTDWVVPRTSIGSLDEDWYADEYCSQRPIPKASSSWPPSLCAYYQSLWHDSPTSENWGMYWT